MANREEIKSAQRWFTQGGHGYSTAYGRILSDALTALTGWQGGLDKEGL